MDAQEKEPTTTYRHARKFLSASILVMGACGIVYEYTLGVLGNNLMGSSHEQIFVIIGIMMFAMGVGSAMQQRILGALVDKFVFIETLLGLIGGTATLIVYTSFAYMVSYQVVLFSFAFVIGTLIGLEIPIAIRINEKFQKNLRGNLSSILSMDYVGALFGALVFAYVLLTKLSIGKIGVLVGIANCLLSIVVLCYFWSAVKRKTLLSLFAIASLTILGACYIFGDRWVSVLEQRCYKDPIVHRQTTTYQHLVLTKSTKNDRLTLFINGHRQFSSDDEKIYHELLVHPPMALASSRERVLILGGGDGLALRDVLRYDDVREVTLVDIDPAITELCSTHPEIVALNEDAFRDSRVITMGASGVTPGELEPIERPSKLVEQGLNDDHYTTAEVRLVHIDADLFLRDVREKFDVAILDFPDPRIVELAKLYSVDFYRQLQKRLEPDAIVSIQSTSPYNAKRAFLCIGDTLREAGFQCLPYHQNVPTFDEWGWHLAWTTPTDPATMLERIRGVKELRAKTDYITTELMAAAFVFGKGWLEFDGEIEPNTKMRPTLVRYYREAFQ